MFLVSSLKATIWFRRVRICSSDRLLLLLACCFWDEAVDLSAVVAAWAGEGAGIAAVEACVEPALTEEAAVASPIFMLLDRAILRERRAGTIESISICGVLLLLLTLLRLLLTLLLSLLLKVGVLLLLETSILLICGKDIPEF